jgi:hypothetical protein
LNMPNMILRKLQSKLTKPQLISIRQEKKLLHWPQVKNSEILTRESKNWKSSSDGRISGRKMLLGGKRILSVRKKSTNSGNLMKKPD